MDGSSLKKIAVVTMFIDHFGAAFFIIFTSIYRDEIAAFPGADMVYWLMRGIGRCAFPLFCFLLVEGFCHTRSRWKYMGRLGMFAVLSEVPFDLAFWNKLWEPAHQNVFLTLLLGFMAMMGAELLFRPVIGKKETSGRLMGVCKALAAAVLTVLCVVTAYVLHTDYGIYGVILILLMYCCRQYRAVACLAGYVWLMQMEPWSFPAFVLMYFYNGKKGSGNKYFYYFFYPLHALALAGLRFGYLKFLGL